MIQFVIDASVVLTHQLETNKTVAEEFNQILKQIHVRNIQLLSIPLLYLEISNALHLALSKESLAQDTFKKITKLPIKIIPVRLLDYSKILSLSYANNTTTYDTAYHVLAISRNATFLTCDQDYYRKAQRLNHIKLLN